MKDKQPNRIPYVDVARAVAIISITTNHAYNRSFATDIGTQAEYLALPFLVSVLKTLAHSFSRLGVPIFLMITGTLLLPRDYSKNYSKFLKHNWLRLFITTEIWLAIMFWYLQLFPSSILFTNGFGYCLLRFFMTLLFINPVTMHSMWYMEMILCVYLLIPILSVALQKLPTHAFWLPLVIVVVCSFVLVDFNSVLAGFGISTELSTSLTSGNVFSMFVAYLLIGYWISQGSLQKFSTAIIVLFFVVFFLLISALQLWIYSTKSDIIVAKGYKSVLLLGASTFLFELFRRMRYKNGGFLKSCRFLADISFGIYFVHICIMEGLKRVLSHYLPGIHYFGKFFFLEIISFLGAIILIQIVRKNSWLAFHLLGIKHDKHKEA